MAATSHQEPVTPVLARSVGSLCRSATAAAAIVFRVPGHTCAYSAHVSEDATVFVQSREVRTVVVRMCRVCAHELYDRSGSLAPTHVITCLHVHVLRPESVAL